MMRDLKPSVDRGVKGHEVREPAAGRWRVTGDSVAQVHGNAYVTDDPSDATYPHVEGSLSTSGEHFIGGFYWWRVDCEDARPFCAYLNGLEARLAELEQRDSLRTDFSADRESMA